MSVNVSVVTDTSVDITEAVVESYKSNVVSHIQGDFSRHNEIRVHAVPFEEPATGYTVTDFTMRIQVTDASGNEVILAVPAIPTTDTFNPDGLPIILQQPIDTQVFENSEAQFEVTVASDSPASYQWYFSDLDTASSLIPGATSASYIIPTTTVDDEGTYQVIVTNSGGTAVSDLARLTLL